MIKVLFLIHDLHYGGAEKVLVNLANYLDKTKYDVTVQTLFDVGHNKDSLNDDVKYIGGLKKMFRGNITLMNLFSPEFLCRVVVKGDYDIVVSFLEGSPSRILSAYNGKKVTWIHTDFYNNEIAASGFRSFDEAKKCYSKFNRIIAVSDTVRRDFEKTFSLNGLSEVLYNVNDSNKIEQLALEEQDVIVKNDNYYNIISVGKLDCSTKGFDNLIRIHKKLIDNGINNNLFILGEGQDRGLLENLIRELGVQDSCTLLGFDKNPYKYVANADLYVCSSHREGFSTAVTEAMILGVPVVSTSVSGAKELLGCKNEFGIVTNDNFHDLFNSVYSVLSDDELLFEYIEKAKDRGKLFSAENTTKSVERMLEKVLKDES